MKKVWLMIIVALLIYTGMDILIWQRIFEDSSRYLNVLTAEVTGYHVVWSMILAGLIVLGSIGLWKDWKKILVFVGATLTLAHSGLEDIFYYWLDARVIPTALPWLDNAPLIINWTNASVTNTQLIMSAAIWIIFWLFVTFIIVKIDG